MRRSAMTFYFAVAACGVAAADAQAASVKEVFEKYGLIGTYAWDCSRPPSGDNNWYFVNRLIDADHVQRDYMTGPTTRLWFSIIDKATELKPNEIVISGKITGRIAGSTVDGQSSDGVWRIEANRMQQWSGTVAGKPIIANGKQISTGREIPWLNKCGAR